MNISVWRKRAGLTQAQVAKTLGIWQSTVTGWEKGKTFPRVTHLPKLAELYGCTVDDLLNCKKEGK